MCCETIFTLPRPGPDDFIYYRCNVKVIKVVYHINVKHDTRTCKISYHALLYDTFTRQYLLKNK